MHDTMESLLAIVRERRGFDPRHAVDAKADLINDYFTWWGLDAAVVGVSGGVDSAVVTALMSVAAERPGSPIQVVAPISLPAFTADRVGVSGQWEAMSTATLLVNHLGLELSCQNIGPAVEALACPAPQHRREWVIGQLVPVVRTAALYQFAAKLQADGYRSLVVGTTNRDEGSYLGFFGKASDASVDLQVISDFHKSEVTQVARLLNIPGDVVDAVPTGDVWDGRTDEEMIGAPYWFVELYTALRCRDDGPALVASLSVDERVRYDEWAAAVEALHVTNLHKYQAPGMAVHLDVYPRSVPGGW